MAATWGGGSRPSGRETSELRPWPNASSSNISRCTVESSTVSASGVLRLATQTWPAGGFGPSSRLTRTSPRDASGTSSSLEESVKDPFSAANVKTAGVVPG